MSNLIYQGKRVNFAGKQIKTPALHTDLVGYWKLDEADGSVYDSYGNFHGSILNAGSGVIQNQPGKINNAYQFNRDSSGAVYLPMEQFYAYQSDFTFTAWVYWYLNPDISASIDLGIIGGETGSGSFFINKGTTYNYLRLESVALDLTGTGANFCPSASEWAFVAVTCKYIDDTHTKQVFYINDASVGTSKTWGYPFVAGRSSYTIGVKRPDQNQHFFNGYIDEVGIWKRALSNDEIMSLYNGSAGKTFPFMKHRESLLSGLKAYWKLDETSGLPSDSVYSHDVITNTGVTLGQSGKIDKSARFELANNDVLVVGTHDDLRLLNKSFSYSAWIYPTSIFASGQFRGILGGIESTQWGVHSVEGESLRLRLMDENYIEYSTTPMYTDQWYHVVTVYNKDISANNVTYYVNGVADYLTTDTSFSNGNIKWIGARSDGWENVFTFDGYIDEVGVWNRALSATDVSLLYNKGFGLTYPFNTSHIPSVLYNANTVAWYIYDHPNSTTTTDSSISQWNDISGYGYNLNSSTNGATWPRIDASGITLTDVNDVLSTSTLNYNQPVFVYAVIRQNGNRGDSARIISDYAVTTRLVQEDQPDIRVYAGSWDLMNSDFTVGDWKIMRLLLNGQNSKLTCNNLTPVVGNPGTIGLNGFSIGARGNNESAPVSFKEIIIRNKADSQSEEQAIYNYLSAKYNIT